MYILSHKVTSYYRKNSKKQKKLSFFIKKCPKILLVSEKVVPLHPQYKTSEFWKTNFGVWCNGNTADSGPAFPGSSPGTPTRWFPNHFQDEWLGFFFVTYHRFAVVTPKISYRSHTDLIQISYWFHTELILNSYWSHTELILISYRSHIKH